MSERAIGEAIAALSVRYDEPWRHYHDRTHVAEMTRALHRLTGDPLHPALEVAAWAHDAVYDPRAAPGDNERASADLACRVLVEAGADAELVDEVATLTLATIDHTPPPQLPADRHHRCAAFLDADLWILSSPPDRYDQYEQQIRAEYAFVPEDLYRRARADIMAGFADRERIYLTDLAHRDWDASARRNLSTSGHHGDPPQRALADGASNQLADAPTPSSGGDDTTAR